MEPTEQSAIIEMSCVEARTLLVDYLDGEPGFDTYLRIDAHLHQCGHCSAIYDGVRNVIELLGSEEVFPFPGGLEEKLYDSLVGWGAITG